ncbi:MAG: hypothetical protein AB197_00215 [Parcubacteria bacterium C7867-002]|nr:MAG: hypothetical protein AB197_00215 [Parcubacteria bacterium C7867-002]
MREHTPQWSGPMLHYILNGMVDHYGESSEGLKFRLVRNISKRKVLKMAAGASDPREGKLLQLLYATRQSPVNHFITDDRLAKLFGTAAGRITTAQTHFWKRIDQDLIDVLEEYPPEVMEILVYVIAQPFYSGIRHPDTHYESATTSWASQSLWEVYNSFRRVELARRSLVVRLMAEEGIIEIPDRVGAHFLWSGRPTRWIYFDLPRIDVSDAPGLLRLKDNPYYGELARAKMDRLNITY